MTNNESLELREVWGKWLRISHWGLAFSTLALMVTGWLVKHTPTVAHIASDWHYIVGSVFTLSLLLRIWLLFADKGMANVGRLLDAIQPARMLDMIKFYLTFGKAPLPRWFSHNPIWAPVYLFLFAFMLVTALSGHLQASQPILFGLYLPSIHSGMASLISIFVVAHLIAVFMHDLKGEQADVSAMINGRKLFVIKPLESGPQGGSGVHKISLDDLKSNLTKNKP